MRLRQLLLLALTLILLPLGPAGAVILSDASGTGNTSNPPDDPGWDHVGLRGSLSAVYVGNGWVLTAAHVGTGKLTLDGVEYPWIAGTETLFYNGDATQADLKAFRVQGNPELPDLPLLPIASSTPSVGTPVTLIGDGRNRGDPITWMGIDGWDWAGGFTKRWGTNLIEDSSELLVLYPHTTQTVVMDFSDEADPNRTDDESVGATGDSGGALFAKSGGEWELAGIIVARSLFNGQDTTSSLYGNFTYAADLVAYRDEIIATVRPECSNEVDDDGDGLVDYPDDPGCTSDEDESEYGAACDDGIDNDGDGFTDYPGDIGCNGLAFWTEAPECQDGIDNDGDGKIDWDGGGAGSADPQCPLAADDNEGKQGCGLGFELAALLPLAAALRRRRGPRSG